jgi:hypothetical protein
MKTYTEPDRNQTSYVPTSKTTGWVKLRLAAREMPDRKQNTETYDTTEYENRHLKS